MASLEMGLAEVAEFAINNKELIAIFGTLVIATLTARQRLAIIRRDHGKCQAEEIGMQSKHGGRLEVNHTPPQAWSTENGLDGDDYPIVSLLTLCSKHHDEYHRHDISNAKNEYHKGNTEAFHEMGKRHHVLAHKGEVFWENQYDTAIQTVSRKNDKAARSQGWQWPEKIKRGK